MDFSQEGVKVLLANGVLGFIGAVANYLWVHMTKDVPMRWGLFGTNAFLGWFVGFVIGDFLPADFPGRDGTLALSGFVTYYFLKWLESRCVTVFDKILGRVVPEVGSDKGDK